MAQEACETILFDPARCQTRGTRACQRTHARVPAGPTHACQRGHACAPVAPTRACQRGHACAPVARACQRANALVPARHAFVPAGTLVRAPPPSPHPARGIAPTQVSSGLRRRQRPPSQTGRIVRPPCIAPNTPAAGQPRGPHGPKPRRVCMATRDLALPQTRPGAARHPIKSTPCGTRTRNLRIRGPTPCPLGQGGCAHSVQRPAYTSLSERMGRRIVHINGPTRA